MRVVALTFVVLWLSPAQALPQASDTRAFTILFVDDHEVLYRAGTQRVFQSPRRYQEKAILPMSKPWEVGIGYTSIHRDPKTGTYQLWYQAYAGARAGDPASAANRDQLCSD